MSDFVVLTGAGAGGEPDGGALVPIIASRRRRPDDPPRCFHDSGEIDEHQRKLTCAQCGADLDPYEHLAKIARQHDRYRYENEEARRRAKKATAEMEEIERKLKNAKARLRRAER